MTRRLLSLLLAGVVFGAGIGLGLRAVRAFETPAVLAAPLPEDFTEIAQRSTPAVVNISAEQVIRTERSPFLNDPFFREFFGHDLPFRVPQEERKRSLGSGVLVSSDGLIVTNHHVIEQASAITITTSDNKSYKGRLVGLDTVTDLAVIRIDAKAQAALPWGDSNRARVGEYVLAVGNPFQLNQTVTMGIISAVGRSNIGIVDYEDFIQTDAAINPGNSGGALVNTRGELIGINTAIYSETGGYQGIGFAVPANLARQVVEDIVAHGRVQRGWVGITEIQDTPHGVLVRALLRGSPAHRAGIEPGDLIVALEGRPVTSAQLRHALAGARPGALIRLEIQRGQRRFPIRIGVEGTPTDA